MARMSRHARLTGTLRAKSPNDGAYTPKNEEDTMANNTAFDKFISADNAWMHEALDVLDAVFGVTDTTLATDTDGKLVITVELDGCE